MSFSHRICSRFCSKDRKKIPLFFSPQGVGKINHLEIYSEHSTILMAYSPGKLFCQSMTEWGFMSAQLTLEEINTQLQSPFILPVSLKQGVGENQPEEHSWRRYRLTKRLRPCYRMAAYFSLLQQEFWVTGDNWEISRETWRLCITGILFLQEGLKNILQK